MSCAAGLWRRGVPGVTDTGHENSDKSIARDARIKKRRQNSEQCLVAWDGGGEACSGRVDRR